MGEGVAMFFVRFVMAMVLSVRVRSQMIGVCGTSDGTTSQLFLVTCRDSYGDGWNGNVMSLTDCHGQSYSPDSDPITVDEDSSEKKVYACMPDYGDMDEGHGIIITVDGGEWQSEVSWEIEGPCDAMTEDFACEGGHAFLSGGAPYAKAIECTTHAPTPLQVDDIPEVETCDEGGMSLYMARLYDSYGDGWNDNVMTLQGCDGNSYNPDEDPITVKADRASETVFLCLPDDVENAGLIVEVDGGSWQSECSWEIVGPCDVASADEACAGGTLFLDGGAPYYKNYNEVCGGTEVPTPLSVDDIPEELTCSSGEESYILLLHDSYGDGWNDNVMTLSDCDGESYTPEEDPITIKADHDAATIWVCLPSDVETAGLIVKVDDGTWPSEVSWEIVGPCDHAADDDEACSGGSLFLYGSAPYYNNFDNVCGGTEVPTPLFIDDIPDEVACGSGEDNYLILLHDSYGDGWNDNVMTLTDCDGNSLLPDEDPVTVREDRNAETIRACLPSDIASTGLLVEVDGGSWQSEVSWEIIGPCGEEADDAYYYYVYGGHKACPDGEIFLDGGAPYYKNYNEVCGGTEVPTPLSVDDIPDETTCVAGTDHYLLALSDSYGDGWNDNVLTLTDCDGNSYTPEEDPITVREDRDTEAIWVCLPTSIQELGLIITVDGGEWQSEVSWELIGPCADWASPRYYGYDYGYYTYYDFYYYYYYYMDEACPGGELVVGGGAPFYQNFNNICGATALPTPMEVIAEDDDVPEIVSCDSSADPYLVRLYDSFGDGWNGNTMELTDCLGNSFIPELDPLTVDEDSETVWVCLPEDASSDLIVRVDGGSWQSEISWEIVGPCDTDVGDESDAEGEACPGGELFLDGGAPALSTECPSPAPTACIGQLYRVDMIDQYGDGWNDNELRLLDCDDRVLAEGLTLKDGEEEQVFVCGDSVSHLGVKVQVGGGSWQSEVSWDVSAVDSDSQTSGGTLLLSGGAPAAVDNCLSCQERGGQNLTVFVQNAKVPPYANSEWWEPKSDPYTIIEVAGKELHTSVKSDTNHPAWNEYLNFGCVVRAEEINAHHSMYVTVRDYDQLTSDDLLVYRPIENWANEGAASGYWKEGEIRKFNDTSSADGVDVGANSEYWVSIAFYWGGGLSPGPTPQPLENDDDNGEDDKGWDDDNSATDDHHSKDGDDHNHGHGHHDDDDANTAGVAVGATFGVLAFLAIVIGGCFYCARTRGHSGPNSAFFSEVYSDMMVGASSPYSSMGSQNRMNNRNTTFNQLRAEVNDSGMVSKEVHHPMYIGRSATETAKGGYSAPSLMENSNEDEVEIGGLYGGLSGDDHDSMSV